MEFIMGSPQPVFLLQRIGLCNYNSERDMGKAKNDSYLISLILSSRLLLSTRYNFPGIISLTGLIFTSCNATEPEQIDYHNKILFTFSRSGYI